MKETEQLKKLMEAVETVYRPVEEADADPMTGEPQGPSDNSMVFDWKASPEDVINTINNNLGGYGIKFKMYGDGDDLYVDIIRVDS